MEQGEQIRKMEDPRESKINQWMSKSVLDVKEEHYNEISLNGVSESCVQV